jgi:hypothetical protein
MGGERRSACVFSLPSRFVIGGDGSTVINLGNWVDAPLNSICFNSDLS